MIHCNHPIRWTWVAGFSTGTSAGIYEQKVSLISITCLVVDMDTFPVMSQLLIKCTYLEDMDGIQDRVKVIYFPYILR